MGVPGPVMPDGYVEVCGHWRGSEPAERAGGPLRRHSAVKRKMMPTWQLGEMWQEAEKAILTWLWSL